MTVTQYYLKPKNFRLVPAPPIGVSLALSSYLIKIKNLSQFKPYSKFPSDLSLRYHNQDKLRGLLERIW